MNSINNDNFEIQEAGAFGFSTTKSDTRIESSVKQLNSNLKLQLEELKKGQAHKFTRRLQAEVNEIRSDLHDIINSDYNAKRQFYTLLNQWAQKFDKPVDGKAPFEIFLEDLQMVFGKNKSELIQDGSRSLYDDVDFFNALQPTINNYIKTQLANMATADADKSKDKIVHMITILSENFTILKKDPSVIRTLGLCESILKTLAITAGKNPIQFIDILNAIYKALPMFRYGCGEQKVIDMIILWLEKDAADGLVKNQSNYDPNQFDLILKKLGTFEQLYVIIPTLVTDRKMKHVLYGKNKSDDGKLINWMKYVRQFLQQRKWDTEGKEKSKYMTAFIDSYYNLTKFTFPQLFGTSESTTAKIKEEESTKGFFDGLLNLFSNKSKKQTSDFQKIRNNLYKETINWLNILKTHEFLKLLRASLTAFPDIITHNTFPRATELDNKILSIFDLYIDKQTGQPIKQEGKFDQMKRTLDNLGKLFKNHREEGNIIDKLYNDRSFNVKFYGQLKKVVEFYPKEAAIAGITLKKSEANWNSINAQFYDKLFSSVIAIDGIVIEQGIHELEDYVSHRLEIESVENFLPRRITGKTEIKDQNIIEAINLEKVGKNSIIRKETAKNSFIKILLALKKEYKNINPKSYLEMYFSGELIEPAQAFIWYMDTEFYSDTLDKNMNPITQLKEEIQGPGNKSNLENIDRVEPRNLSGDVQMEQISEIVDENLPEVSSLSNEITNLLKIIEEQGNHLSQTDTLIDQLIQDESTLLDNVSDKIADVNRMIEANDLEVHSKKKNTKSTTTTKTTTKTVTEDENEEQLQTGGSIKNKYYVANYITGTGKQKALWRIGMTDTYFYVNDFNKKKRVDVNSSRILW